MKDIKVIIFIFLITIPICLSSTYSKPQDQKNISDSMKLEKVDSLTSSLKEEIKQIKESQIEKEIEFAKQHIERANRIIDWTSMMFAALAILLVIAGAIGLNEFTKIRNTERNMKEMLNEIKKELDELKKQRSDIVKETKVFTELIYYYNEGMANYHSGEYLKARELLFKVIDLKRDHVDALYLIGKSYVAEDNLEDAISSFEKILTIDPENSKAYLGLARCYKRQDKIERAISYFEKAIELDPQNASAFDSLGLTYRQIGKLEEAISCYLKARGIRKNSESVFFIGLIYYAQSEFINAKKYFDEALYLSQQEIEEYRAIHWAYFHIGVIEGLRNNLKEAKNYLLKSYECNKAIPISQAKTRDLKFLLDHEKNDETKENIKKMIAIFKQ